MMKSLAACIETFCKMRKTCSSTDKMARACRVQGKRPGRENPFLWQNLDSCQSYRNDYHLVYTETGCSGNWQFSFIIP